MDIAACKLGRAGLVDPVVRKDHEQGRNDTHADESQLQSMSQNIPRAVGLAVEVGRHSL